MVSQLRPGTKLWRAPLPVMGHFRRIEATGYESGLPSIADILLRRHERRGGPTGDIRQTTFIGRIERGFDFLSYHFSPARLTVAKKTIPSRS